MYACQDRFILCCRVRLSDRDMPFSSTIEVESRSVEFISVTEASNSVVFSSSVVLGTNDLYQCGSFNLHAVLSYWGCGQVVHTNLHTRSNTANSSIFRVATVVYSNTSVRAVNQSRFTTSTMKIIQKNGSSATRECVNSNSTYMYILWIPCKKLCK